MKKQFLTLAAVAAAALPFAANAGGFYVGAGIGQASFKTTEFLSAVEGSDLKFSDSDFAYNLFAGYQVTDAVAVELGWQDWGKEKDQIDGDDVEIKPSMVTLMAVGTAPINDSWSLFGKAGVAFQTLKINVVDYGSASDHSQDLALGGGVQWNAGAFGVRLEGLWVDSDIASKSMMWGVSGLYKFGG